MQTDPNISAFPRSEEEVLHVPVHGITWDGKSMRMKARAPEHHEPCFLDVGSVAQIMRALDHLAARSSDQKYLREQFQEQFDSLRSDIRELREVMETLSLARLNASLEDVILDE
jgi:hypothetical protein